MNNQHKEKHVDRNELDSSNQRNDNQEKDKIQRTKERNTRVIERSKEDIRRYIERKTSVSSSRGELRNNVKNDENKTITTDLYPIEETRNSKRIFKRNDQERMDQD